MPQVRVLSFRRIGRNLYAPFYPYLFWLLTELGGQKSVPVFLFFSWQLTGQRYSFWIIVVGVDWASVSGGQLTLLLYGTKVVTKP